MSFYAGIQYFMKQLSYKYEFAVSVFTITYTTFLFLKNCGIQLPLIIFTAVFHRILDFKTGCISMLPFFYAFSDSFAAQAPSRK